MAKAATPSTKPKRTVKRGQSAAAKKAAAGSKPKAAKASSAAGKSLVIVESPAKAKTINKYLGSDYVVRSSIGHVRDLPTSGSSAADKEALKKQTEGMSREEKATYNLIRRMGVDPEHGWSATYAVLPGKEKVVSELKTLAKKADHVYIATDMDREGEAIGWHLRELLGGSDDKYSRVVFNEITKTAIQKAFEAPGQLDMDRVNAQQARRFLDRVVGYMISPLLWAKIARGLSAGRVQSVALKLVVEKEREIRAFIPTEYWQIHTDTLVGKGKSVSDLMLEATKYQGKTLEMHSEADASQIVSRIEEATLKISSRDERPTQSKPSAPFITSTLQQAASTRLGYSVKKTMIMAQRLYEAGYITYMRTDSTFLSADALTMARSYIEKSFGSDYLPKAPITYGNKQNAQEAHEAIRPSSVTIKSADLKGVERDAQRLYELIWRQFVACQMVPARYLSVTLLVDADGVELKARGRIMTFAGFTKVQPPAKSEDVILPDVKAGDTLELKAVLPTQHFTKPPARFTEASLVKELEKQGIGRPSTYASIISTIQDRGYVTLENRRLYAQKMGDIVTDRLSESFPDLMDYAFTAKLEGELDDVANGKEEWKVALDRFYGGFKKKLEAAKGDTGMRPNDPVDVPEIHCDLCERGMQIRTGTTGVFLGCTGYNLPPKERCKGTKNLAPAESMAALFESDDDTAETQELMNKRRCPVCATAMDSYIIDATTKLHICGNNPDCSGHEIETGEFKIKGYDGPTIPCNKCDGQMELKTGRFGPYFGCQECDNTRKVLKNGEPAPPRMDPIELPDLLSDKHDDHFILREGAAGLFMAASKFPKIRETRAPKVAELQDIASKLEDKFQYLLDAPTEDDEDNPTVLRWSRKLGEQYVSSEKEGKFTKFALYHRKGKWVDEA